MYRYKRPWIETALLAHQRKACGLYLQFIQSALFKRYPGNVAYLCRIFSNPLVKMLKEIGHTVTAITVTDMDPTPKLNWTDCILTRSQINENSTAG